MYVVVVNFQIKSENTAEFMEAVMRQARNSLDLEDQCHVFDVCLDPDDPGSVMLYEHYEDRQAFDAHLESEHFRSFDREVAPAVLSKSVSTWLLQEAGS